MSRDELARLVERWRKELLPEWRVILHDEPLEDMDTENAWAVCRVSEDYSKIQVHFVDELLTDQSDEEIEATVVHELLHALTKPWRTQLDAVSYELGQLKTSALRERAEHEEEKLVDRLAYLLVGRTRGVAHCRTINGTELVATSTPSAATGITERALDAMRD